MPPRKPKKQVQPEDEFTPLTGAELNTTLKLKKEKVNDLRTKRNYIQQDRDKFKIDLEYQYRDTEQRVRDVRFRVKSSNISEGIFTESKTFKDGNEAKSQQKVYYQRRTQKMKEQKKLLKQNYTKFQKNYIMTSEELDKEERLAQQMNKKQNKNILQQLQTKYQQRYQRLIQDLQLKLKVQQHQLQQRKNLHINQLVRNFQQAFANLKAYNNQTTSDNLRIIKQHRADIKKLNQQVALTKKSILQLTQSNKNQKGPLQKLRKKKDQKLLKLKYFQKQKNSLQNYKSKLHVLKQKKIKLQKNRKQLQEQIDRLQTIKKNLQEKFGRMTNQVRQHAKLKNVILNQKLQSLSQKLQEKQVNMNRIRHISSIDPAQVDQISKKVQNAMDQKNSIIRNLQYTIHHATKAYNDAIRVYETKLVQFGIPQQQLGFQPLQTPTSTMPAGLVAS